MWATIAAGRRLIFFFNDTATTEIYTLSLHDALPISCDPRQQEPYDQYHENSHAKHWDYQDRKSGSAGMPRPISYAVFCLKKKNPLELHLHRLLGHPGHHLRAARAARAADGTRQVGGGDSRRPATVGPDPTGGQRSRLGGAERSWRDRLDGGVPHRQRPHQRTGRAG